MDFVRVTGRATAREEAQRIWTDVLEKLAAMCGGSGNGKLLQYYTSQIPRSLRSTYFPRLANNFFYPRSGCFEDISTPDCFSFFAYLMHILMGIRYFTDEW